MIEIIYKEENQEEQEQEQTLSIPRNIRQVGQVREDYKIYIEDYVYTFLVRLSRAEEDAQKQKGRTAVLTGETKWCAGVFYLFIKGAIVTEDEEATTEYVDFGEKIWKKVYEEQSRFFENQEIVGWFFTQPQLPLKTTELFTKVHLKHFGGEKVLMLMEPLEKEDAFFYYENNSMVRVDGYYIYYEKNPGMQEYMFENNTILQPVATESCKDDAVRNFRKIIAEKNEEKQEREIPSLMSYAVTVCLAAAVLLVGINFYRDYQGMTEEGESRAASSVIVEDITPSAGQTKQKDNEKKATESITNSVETEKKKQEDARKESNFAAGTKENDKNSDALDMNTSGGDENTGISGEEANGKKNSENSENAGSSPKTKETDGGGADPQTQEMQSDTDSTAQDAEKNTSTEETASDNMQDQTQQVPEEVYQEEADVRKAQKRAREAAEKENAEAVSASHESYVIQPGDTLFLISMERYGNIEKIREICELNNLSVDQIIYPGQVIVLP